MGAVLRDEVLRGVAEVGEGAPEQWVAAGAGAFDGGDQGVVSVAGPAVSQVELSADTTLSRHFLPGMPAGTIVVIPPRRAPDISSGAAAQKPFLQSGVMVLHLCPSANLRFVRLRSEIIDWTDASLRIFSVDAVST